MTNGFKQAARFALPHSDNHSRWHMSASERNMRW
jgi:hypothetical protein